VRIAPSKLPYGPPVIQTQIPERVENLDARAVLLRSVAAVIADIEQESAQD